MDIEEIESFLRSEFPRITGDDRQDLVSAAWLFLNENDASEPIDADDLAVRLKKHLSDELNGGNWREVGVADLSTRSGTDPTGRTETQDEALSSISQKTRIPSVSELNQEIDAASIEFDRRQEELRNSLPPILFEALHRSVSVDAPVHWTATFDENSLKVLCWRAILRLRWKN